MKPLTAIAVSGGIDSLMAAHLLKEKGHNVIGIHFVTGYEDPVPADTQRPHLSKSHEIFSIAEQLGIDIELFDCSTEFKNGVVDYFIRTYHTGQTPNPCIVCNPLIKFGTVFNFARKLGASTLATGHYARIKGDRHGRFHLYKGIDPKKDQSYFLARLTQQHLAGARFPLGNMNKSDVIQLADVKGFKPVKKTESQDVCFIKGKNYGDFLARQKGFEPKPGLIKDIHGNTLGEHNGLHLFTVGQRRGINCPASEPYYVIRMDTRKNLLTVGFKKDLLASRCNVEDINWIHETPGIPVDVHTRLRYRHTAAASRLIPVNGKKAIIRFEKPQAAVTPGQCAVFYKGDEVLGGGWIAPD
ncbi:MAG: tRNA 2-thiouridine(34) synthase MnmA [Deltaproteobacteria bacterium]|nr:tRNA 2-thiouridine(34) synthase MnmA [Deltaproteobacteria bacterium]